MIHGPFKSYLKKIKIIKQKETNYANIYLNSRLKNIFKLTIIYINQI